jgi:hypothetical protein
LGKERFHLNTDLGKTKSGRLTNLKGLGEERFHLNTDLGKTKSGRLTNHKGLGEERFLSREIIIIIILLLISCKSGFEPQAFLYAMHIELSW